MALTSSIATLASKAAANQGIPDSLFLALIEKESSGNPYAVSSKGAIGLGQLMPGTAADLGVNPWVPEDNLRGAAQYLKAQFDRFGNWRDALRAYNAGPEAALRNPSVSQDYASSILAAADVEDTSAPENSYVDAFTNRIKSLLGLDGIDLTQYANLKAVAIGGGSILFIVLGVMALIFSAKRGVRFK